MQIALSESFKTSLTDFCASVRTKISCELTGNARYAGIQHGNTPSISPVTQKILLGLYRGGILHRSPACVTFIKARRYRAETDANILRRRVLPHALGQSLVLAATICIAVGTDLPGAIEGLCQIGVS